MGASGKPPAHWVTITEGFVDGSRCWIAKCRCKVEMPYIKKSAAQEWANTHEDSNYRKGMDYYFNKGTRY